MYKSINRSMYKPINRVFPTSYNGDPYRAGITTMGE